LTAAGFNTVEKIAGASVKELSGIKGIGKKSAENLIESSKELLKGKK